MSAQHPGGSREANDSLLVEALASGLSWRKAAQAANVAPSTVTLRMKDPEFRRRVEERREDDQAERRRRRSDTLNLLDRLAQVSLGKLLEVMQSQAASDGVKVAAAQTVLRHAMPQLVAVAVVEEQEQEFQQEEALTLADLFEIPDDADEVNVIDLARHVGETIKRGVVDGQARPARPPERVAHEEREYREAARVPQPAQRPAPRQEPTLPEDEARTSVARQREEDLRREDDVQQAAMFRAREEAEREREQRASVVPWHLRQLLDGLPDGERQRVLEEMTAPETAQDHLDVLRGRGWDARSRMLRNANDGRR